jgi:hypothetical protein
MKSAALALVLLCAIPLFAKHKDETAAVYDRTGTVVRKVPSDATEVSRPAPGRYVPVGSDPRAALDTQTGRLCRTVEAADAHSDLPLCGSYDDEQVVEVDVDTKRTTQCNLPLSTK